MKIHWENLTPFGYWLAVKLDRFWDSYGFYSSKQYNIVQAKLRDAKLELLDVEEYIRRREKELRELARREVSHLRVPDLRADVVHNVEQDYYTFYVEPERVKYSTTRRQLQLDSKYRQYIFESIVELAAKSFAKQFIAKMEDERGRFR